MIGWLWRILIGRFTSCRHKWSFRHRVQVWGSEDTSGLPIGSKVVLQCEHCGDIKSAKV